MAEIQYKTLCQTYGIDKSYEWFGTISEWRIVEGFLKEKNVTGTDLADFNVLWTTHPNQQLGKPHSRLNDFRWKPSETRKQLGRNQSFPFDGFGPYILKRAKVIDMVMSDIMTQHEQNPGNPASVYLSGPRGMGKSCTLELIAERLNDDYEVFSFDAPYRIPKDLGQEILSIARSDAKKKIAIIIDEVPSLPIHAVFVSILKQAPSNVVTIGAGVPGYDRNITATFRTVLRMPDLAFEEDDDDVQKLLKDLVVHENESCISATMANNIAKFLIAYCGGHIFPVLSFLEYFLKHVPHEYISDETNFIKHFCSPGFANSAVFTRVKNRCFYEIIHDHESIQIAHKVLSGRGQSYDTNLMMRLGWWNAKIDKIISPLLLQNLWFNDVAKKPEKVKLIIPEIPKSQYEDDRMIVESKRIGQFRDNMEMTIAAGFENMVENDFRHADTWLTEDAISFNWAMWTKESVHAVFIMNKIPGKNGWCDFYVNGFVDGAIEFLRNGKMKNTHDKGQDVGEHLNRFKSGKYPWKRFGIVNVVLDKACAEGRARTYQKVKKDEKSSTSEEDIEEVSTGKYMSNEVAMRLLPNDSDDQQDNIYTYIHYKNFLYRGRTLIRAPAVVNLPCRPPNGWQPPLPPSSTMRKFSTAVNRPRAYRIGSHVLRSRGALPLFALEILPMMKTFW